MAEHSALRRISNIIITAVFVTTISLPLVRFSPAPWTDPIEKRSSAPPPDFPISLSEARHFPGGFEAFFNDHFGLRRWLIHTRNLIDFNFFKQSPSPRVVIGRDNWLFYVGDRGIEYFTGQFAFSPKELDSWAVALKQRSDWFHAHVIAYDFIVAPNKDSIYPEFMPSSLIERKHNNLDALKDRIVQESEASVLVDLRPALLSQKGDLPLYHPIDQHWNDYGGYLGYRSVIAKLNADGIPGVHSLDLQAGSFARHDLVAGDLSEMMGFSQYPVTVQTSVYTGPSLPCAPHEIASISDSMRRYGPDTTSDCALAGQGARVLVFHDSMITAMQNYLANSFSHVRYVWAMPSLDDMKRYVELEHPDIVIEERAERMLVNVPHMPAQ